MDAREYFGRGEKHFNERNFDEAIADFTEAIQLEPDDPSAYFGRGLSYMNKEEFDLSIADFTEAIQLEPDDSSAYFWRSFSYRNKEESNLAIADLEMAVRLDPEQESYREALEDLKSNNPLATNASLNTWHESGSSGGKSRLLAYLLLIFLGFTGAHMFYIRNKAAGIRRLIVLGLFIAPLILYALFSVETLTTAIPSIALLVLFVLWIKDLITLRKRNCFAEITVRISDIPVIHFLVEDIFLIPRIGPILEFFKHVVDAFLKVLSDKFSLIKVRFIGAVVGIIVGGLGGVIIAIIGLNAGGVGGIIACIVGVLLATLFGINGAVIGYARKYDKRSRS